MSSFEIKQKDILVTNTSRARAREHPAWRGRRHFLEADCLPLLSLSIKLVCVCVWTLVRGACKIVLYCNSQKQRFFILWQVLTKYRGWAQSFQFPIISEPASSYVLIWNLWFLCMYCACIYRHNTGTYAFALKCIYCSYVCMCMYGSYMYVYTCICLYVHMIYLYAYMHMSVHICMYMLVLYVYVCICVCNYMHLCMNVTYVFVCISMYMCISLQYIHIHANTSVYMLISLDAFYSMRRAGYVCV